MSLNAHVTELKRKHKSLNEQVQAAERSPGMDRLAIAELKKAKLRLKEEITKFSNA